jgi:chromosomal replication initiation ATPase DnaA
VIHSIRKVENEMEKDPSFRKQVDEAREEMREAFHD